MTRKRRRLWILLLCGLGLGTATALVLTALDDHLVFFFSPSDLAQRPQPPGRLFRVGGLVEPGSVERPAAGGNTGASASASAGAASRTGATVRFRITDGATTLPVRFSGLLPDLFREGQGVVAQGRIGADGVFEASEVLARHDESYMPPEVADALRRSGHWKPGEPPPGSRPASAPARAAPAASGS